MKLVKIVCIVLAEVRAALFIPQMYALSLVLPSVEY